MPSPQRACSPGSCKFTIIPICNLNKISTKLENEIFLTKNLLFHLFYDVVLLYFLSTGSLGADDFIVDHIWVQTMNDRVLAFLPFFLRAGPSEAKGTYKPIFAAKILVLCLIFVWRFRCIASEWNKVCHLRKALLVKLVLINIWKSLHSS